MKERSVEQWAQWGVIAVFVVNTVFLVLYHTGMDHDTEASVPDTRSAVADSSLPIQSTLDKILFGGLVLMAVELLDFLTKNSGSKHVRRCVVTDCRCAVRTLTRF